MARISLKSLISKNKQMAEVIAELAAALDAAIVIEDAEGRPMHNFTELSKSSKVEKATRHPVRLDEEILGWVTGGEPAAHIASLLTLFAGKEAEKKTLGNEVLGLYREINLIYSFSEKLSSSLDLTNVADTALGESSQLIEADGGVVMLFDEQSEKLEVTASFGLDIDRAAGFKVGAGIIGSIVASGNAEITNDVHSDARAVANERAFSSMICAPLKIDEQVKGVIALMSSAQVVYTAAQLKLLMAIASQAAMGIENALLHVKLVAEATRKIELQRQELEKAVQERTAEIKATQQQLIQAEKLASLGQLTAGIAHEIKNPLNFVNNFSQLLGKFAKSVAQEIRSEQEKLGEEKAAAISESLGKIEQLSEKIKEHGQRADSIVKSMMEHARTGKAERTPTDLNKLLDESANLVYHGLRARQTGFNITIEKDYDDSLTPVAIVAQDISRVFLNIIGNACYAADKKGREGEKGNREGGGEFEPTLWLKTKNRGDKVEIRIRDNGAGIPEDIREKIFNPFFTTKPTGQGTGLGLSICHDIVVQAHHGELKMESEEGTFTEFVVSLPRA